MKSYCQMDSEELEKFSMRLANAEETERFEEHLLICENCRQRYEEVESLTAGIRKVGVEFDVAPELRRAWWNCPQLVPSFALLLLLIAGGILMMRSGVPSAQPLAVVLTATRGKAPGGSAEAGRRIALTPDLTGLEASGPYRLEVVNAAGGTTWQSRYDAASGAAMVSAQSAGPHFVRVYSQSGELLREYGLDVRR